MILITIPDARLCADPRIGDANGKPVANLRIASNSRVKVDGEWTSAPLFFDVALWRSVETVETYFRKGSPIVVWGELRPRTWTDRDGVEHEGLEVANAEWTFPPKNDGAGAEASQPRQQQAASPAPAQAAAPLVFGDDDDASIPF